MAELLIDNGALSLNVLVLYEDFGTGLRAKQTFDEAVQGLAFDADMHISSSGDSIFWAKQRCMTRQRVKQSRRTSYLSPHTARANCQ